MNEYQAREAVSVGECSRVTPALAGDPGSGNAPAERGALPASAACLPPGSDRDRGGTLDWEEELEEVGRKRFRRARRVWVPVTVGVLVSACCVTLYVADAARASGGSDWPTVVKHFKAPRAQSFLSIWRPGESGTPVLEQFSLRDGAPLRTLLKLPPRSFREEGVQVVPAVGTAGPCGSC